MQKFRNIEEVYAFFASKKAERWLATKKLKAAVKFFDSPLDFLHQSLPNDVPKENGRNDFVLQYTEFNQMYNKFLERKTTNKKKDS